MFAGNLTKPLTSRALDDISWRILKLGEIFCSCARASFLIKSQALVCSFIKKETLAQVFSFEFCEIS